MHQKTFDYYIDFESNDWFCNLIYAMSKLSQIFKVKLPVER
jgi:hypothetical protein